MSRVSHAFASVHCCLVVTCWERADLLMALVGDIYCILLLSNVVSWVRCDTLLYSFLIFPSFLTLQRHHVVTNVKWNKTRITAYGKCEIAKRRYRKFAKAMYVKVALYKSFNSSIYANLR